MSEFNRRYNKADRLPEMGVGSAEVVAGEQGRAIGGDGGIVIELRKPGGLAFDLPIERAMEAAMAEGLEKRRVPPCPAERQEPHGRPLG